MKKERSAARRQGGHTLVELMVTVSVAGTLAAFVVPSFDGLVQDNRRTAAVNELLATILRARAAAARLHENVVVCGFRDADGDRVLDEAEQVCAGQDWSDGWLAAAWDDTDRDGQIDAGELARPLLQQYANDQPGLRITASPFGAGAAPAGALVLRSFGQASSNGTITVCDRRGAAHARAVIIAPTGRSRAAPRRADGSALRCDA